MDFIAVLTIAVVGGAAALGFKKGTRRRARIPPRSFGELTWRELELAVIAAFQREGYSVALRGGKAADGGVDMSLSRAGERALVQCRQWRAASVALPTVRELYEAMVAEGAGRGYVVACGSLVPEAAEFARERNIVLVEARQLFRRRRKKFRPQVTN
jgi:restriction system protein